MTDITTRPTETGTTSALPDPTPAATAAADDPRTARRIARAEQARISADAEIERHARTAQLDLQLREQRRAAARRERQAVEQDKQDQVRDGYAAPPARPRCAWPPPGWPAGRCSSCRSCSRWRSPGSDRSASP